MEIYESQMLSLFNKKGKNIALLRTVIIFTLIIVYLVYSDFAPIKLIQGPTPLEDISVVDYNNQYVTAEMNLSPGAYMDTSSTDKKTNISTTIRSDYVIPTNDENLMGVSISKSDIELANKIVDETYDWLDKKIEYPTSSLEVKGTLQKMDDEEYRYFVRFMEYLGYTTEEINGFAIPYVLKQGYIGKLNEDAVVLLGITSIGLVLFAIYTLIKAFSGSYQKNILKYIDNNPSISFKELETDFSTAIPVGKKIWVGSRWTFYLDGAAAQLVDNNDTIWAYRSEHTVIQKGGGFNRSISIKLFDINKRYTSLNVKKDAEADQILQIYNDIHNHMVIGYSRELEKCFQKDFDTFLGMKYHSTAQE
ncbi:DUF6709 family protein [Alkaliphilus sp. B6464]|uniref:DUF6709 family protein n=1 Tax=Alkaliphilus sp. B6464 TaxID=2731219 RepID=UPI001BA4EB80|nr:DUF6709 family protein [Alkaliphilus sp. B6464]QUH18655.1 hypothetical protein HYG84_01175 [Alkaliphilus sp. B6464]